MSALPPKADMCSAKGHVRFVPKADMRAPIARRPHRPTLFARVTGRLHFPDLLHDLLQIVARRILQRRERDVALELLQPQRLADGQHVPVIVIGGGRRSRSPRPYP